MQQNLFLQTLSVLPGNFFACDGSETVFQRREQLEESCVFFGAPSFTLDRRIKGINPPVSAKFFRTRIIQLSRLRLQHERFAHSP